MVIFFFVVGLEIKREIQVGELSSFRQAALPVAAALGGMLLPAALYLLVNAGTEGARGWAVPMATDIAFALGVMALAGSRVPLSLKVFLTALAIVDDIGAVLVIALFYTAEIVWLNLALAGLFLGLLIVANIVGARSPILYALLGIGLWAAFLGSGLHATLAGILVALTIPARGKIHSREFLSRARKLLHDFEHTGETDKGLLTSHQQEALQSLEDAAQEIETPLQRLEHALHPWVTFGIIPLFALANAGVSLGGDLLSIFLERVSLGVILGLLVGKQVGVSLAAWLAVKLKLADLPEDVSWKQIYAVGWLAGIGFTMSLFVSALAFGEARNLEAAKVGILGASLIAGIVGFFLLRINSGKETRRASANERRHRGNELFPSPEREVGQEERQKLQ
jgi:NhaA family Na+:H+ antiporter